MLFMRRPCTNSDIHVHLKPQTVQSFERPPYLVFKCVCVFFLKGRGFSPVSFFVVSSYVSTFYRAAFSGPREHNE